MAELTLTNTNEVSLVDDEDHEQLSLRKWYLAQTGYVMGYDPVYGRSVLLHRVIMGTPTGRVPEYDHIDKDKLNNRKANLRTVTRSQNMFNTDNENKGVLITI
jgi:hypothetical protein